MKRRDLLAVVEAAYAPCAGADEWALGVTQALARLYPHDLPPFVFWSTVRPDGRQDIERVAGAAASPALLEALRAMNAVATPEHVGKLWRHRLGVATVSESLGSFENDAPWREVARRDFASGDSIGLYFPGASGKIVTLNVPLPSARPLEARERTRLQRLVAHIRLGERLIERRGARPSAVLRPDGALIHADAEASRTDARSALRAHVQRIERARRAEDEDLGLTLWRGMVDGQWSLVDEFDADGKRFFVARENGQQVEAPRALTARERQVLALVVEGKRSKLIGYELGLAPSTVSMAVRSVLEKLGAKSRAALVELAESMGVARPRAKK